MDASWHGNVFSCCHVETSPNRVDEETNTSNTGLQSSRAAAGTQPGASHRVLAVPVRMFSVCTFFLLTLFFWD